MLERLKKIFGAGSAPKSVDEKIVEEEVKAEVEAIKEEVEAVKEHKEVIEAKLDKIIEEYDGTSI